MEVVGLQFSQWGAQFYVEAGIGAKTGITLIDGRHVPGNKLKHYQTETRRRFGDQPFNYESQDVGVVASRATGTVSAIVEWFAGNGS
jgi:hypothetical protein